jgi:hypothetical protein
MALRLVNADFTGKAVNRAAEGQAIGASPGGR